MNLTSPKGAAALSIVQRLTDAGHQALFAGGCVRDHLLGSEPTDYDIATSAVPDQVEKLFPKTIPVGKQFGVILVLINGMQFEVATFRTEGGYQDGRRPGFVNFSNAQEDASRRDFTVNGLFYDPLKQQVIDYVDGVKDIDQKLIRCIGNPKQRFDEDKLRLLRAIRFSAKLNFKIETNTWNEVKSGAVQITTVSKERIRDELDKIFLSAHGLHGLKLLAEAGFWDVLFPGINQDVVIRFSKLEIRSIPAAYAILFSDLEKNKAVRMLRDLRYSNEIIQRTMRVLELQNMLKEFSRLRIGEMKRVLSDDRFTDALAVFVTFSNNQSQSIQAKINEWKGQNLRPPAYLNGEDLKKLGIAPGPSIGKILDETYLLQLEDKLKNRDQALAWAKTQI